MKISALDLLTAAEGKKTEQVFQETVQLAKELDKLGYERLWFAEHHGSPTHMSSAPEILATYIAGLTQNIKVGTGGTMIMHYSPLKVAEQFKTLASLAPGRVDLGIGRAPGGSPLAITALAQGREVQPTDLYDKAQTILDYISDQPRKEEIYNRIEASPTKLPILPTPWMLGSSGQSGITSGRMGVAYNFAKFFGIEGVPDNLFAYYRNNFEASEFLDKPLTMSTYQVVVGENQEEVDYLAKPLEINSYLNRFGRFEPLMTAEKAQSIDLDDQGKEFIDYQHKNRVLIKGTPDQVGKALRDEKEKYGFDELMVYTPLAKVEDRMKSYALLMEELTE